MLIIPVFCFVFLERKQEAPGCYGPTFCRDAEQSKRFNKSCFVLNKKAANYRHTFITNRRFVYLTGRIGGILACCLPPTTHPSTKTRVHLSNSFFLSSNWHFLSQLQFSYLVLRSVVLLFFFFALFKRISKIGLLLRVKIAHVSWTTEHLILWISHTKKSQKSAAGIFHSVVLMWLI